MAEIIALVFVGFSIVCATVLLIANLRGFGAELQTPLSRIAGGVMLLGLALMQAHHGHYLLDGIHFDLAHDSRSDDLFAAKTYVVLLFITDPAFYLFFRGILASGDETKKEALQLLHFAPVAVTPFIDGHVAIPLSFALGTVHSLLLLRMAHALRAQRNAFRLERFAFMAFAGIAAFVPLLGLAPSQVGVHAFVVAYACVIGLAFGVVLYSLLRFPDLLGRAGEAVRVAYATSTLGKVDRHRVLAELDRLLRQEKVYSDEHLSLASMAAQVELTPHQLSELINTTFSVSFSRHIREHRVEAAKKMLLAEPSASVLSIGLSVGFTSQSNFYTAFREITGEVPGRFRKGR